MAKEFNEPEELANEKRNENYDPLSEPINEKAYTRPNVNINPADLQGDIPEPSFNPPPMDLGKPKFDEMPKREPQPPINPEMRDMPKKDKQLAASHVSTMIMQGYEWMHDVANKGMVFSEKKLNKLAREGEIDFSIQIPYDYTTNDTIAAGEFINEFNEQQKDTLKVSPKFKEEVTPVLERVLSKRGIGMTDEQFLIYLFGKDIALKGVMFMSARSQMSDMLKMLKEMTEQNGGARTGNPMPPPPRPSDPITPPSNPIPTYEPTESGELVSNQSAIVDIQEAEYFQESISSVQERVDAQLQNKSVSQIRKEQIAEAKAAAGVRPNKPKGRKRKIS